MSLTFHFKEDKSFEAFDCQLDAPASTSYDGGIYNGLGSSLKLSNSKYLNYGGTWDGKDEVDLGYIAGKHGFFKRMTAASPCALPVVSKGGDYEIIKGVYLDSAKISGVYLRSDGMAVRYACFKGAYDSTTNEGTYVISGASLSYTQMPGSIPWDKTAKTLTFPNNSVYTFASADPKDACK